jgi:hypothetical protein
MKDANSVTEAGSTLIHANMEPPVSAVGDGSITLTAEMDDQQVLLACLRLSTTA